MRTAQSAMKYTVIILVDEQGLTQLEKIGFDVRDDTKIGYDKLLGCCAPKPKGYGKGYVIVAPTVEAMRADSRVMRFMYIRMIDRVMRPSTYFKAPPLDYVFIKQGQQERYGTQLLGEGHRPPLLISLDLETTKRMEIRRPGFPVRKFGAVIRMASYTFVYYIDGQWVLKTYVQNVNTVEDYNLLKTIASCKYYKTAHNGAYDQTYLARYRIPFHGYVHDTQNWLRSITPHMKKKVKGKTAAGYYSLQYAANFFMFTSKYWKDGSYSDPDYAARDAHSTACIAIAQLKAASRETFTNFTMSQHHIYSCMIMELRGMRKDKKVRARLISELMDKRIKYNERVAAWFGGLTASQNTMLLPYFQAMGNWARKNKIKGARKIAKADKNAIRDISVWHPLLAHVLGAVRQARATTKLLNTYIIPEGVTEENFNGGVRNNTDEYLLAKYDPFSTLTRRLASSASSLWTGHNFQNVTGVVRDMYRAPRGMVLSGSDLEAVETYCTAFNSQCYKMYKAVSGQQYFHALNAEAFFGIPYERLYDDSIHKKLDNRIINMAKRVNHGANYMMGSFVFIETVGLEMIWDMRELLSLPEDWSPFKIAGYVLMQFDKRFPEVRGRWAAEQAYEVIKTGRLLCNSGYKPMLLESPLANKNTLNSVVATESQHMGTGYLSLKIMHRVLLKEIEGTPWMLLAAVHDETIWAEEAKDSEANSKLYLELADIPIKYPFKWEDGTDAVMRVPTSEPNSGDYWGELK